MATAAEEVNNNGDVPVRCEHLSAFSRNLSSIFPQAPFVPIYTKDQWNWSSLLHFELIEFMFKYSVQNNGLRIRCTG